MATTVDPRTEQLEKISYLVVLKDRQLQDGTNQDEIAKTDKNLEEEIKAYGLTYLTAEGSQELALLRARNLSLRQEVGEMKALMVAMETTLTDRISELERRLEKHHASVNLQILNVQEKLDLAQKRQLQQPQESKAPAPTSPTPVDNGGRYKFVADPNNPSVIRKVRV